MSKIFISYRRDEVGAWAYILYGKLQEIYGRENIFFDVRKDVKAGDYRKAINAALESCSIMIVIMGPRWLNQLRRRSGIDLDPHRYEISEALNSFSIPILIVLVDSADLPRPDQLPTDIHDLPFQSAIPLSRDQPWRQEADYEEIVRCIDRNLDGNKCNVKEIIGHLKPVFAFVLKLMIVFFFVHVTVTGFYYFAWESFHSKNYHQIVDDFLNFHKEQISQVKEEERFELINHLVGDNEEVRTRIPSLVFFFNSWVACQSIGTCNSSFKATPINDAVFDFWTNYRCYVIRQRMMERSKDYGENIEQWYNRLWDNKHPKILEINENYDNSKPFDSLFDCHMS